MQTYYAFKQNGDLLLEDAVKTFDKSISHSYNLYISLFCLLIQIRDYAKQKIEVRQNKFLPNKEDLNPNTRFVDNIIFEKILNNRTVENYIKNSEYNWMEDYELIKNIWGKIEESNFYNKYMNSENNSLEADRDILRKIINKIIIDNDKMDKILEDKNIYWNDDLEYLLSVIIKNINKTPDNSEYIITDDVYKSKDDKKFGMDLLKKTILNSDEFDVIIIEYLQKWDLKRIATLDKVILHLALCELLKMPDIPVKVAINEYLDIAKYYSTQKSNHFINGILDAVYINQKEAGTLNKSGRGLL